MKKVEEILEQLVSFDTVDDKENERIINWISDFCLKAGFETKKIRNKKDNKVGLVVHGGNSKKNGLIFMGHTDTVPAGDGWKTNPFDLTQKNNDFFGLGSSDMKGGIAAMLSSISEIDLKKLNKGLELIFTYDEEKYFGGIKSIVGKHKISADCIVVGEPTSLEPVVATKGMLVFKINFIGKEAHGSNPEIGINAIEMASIFIIEFKKYFRKIEKESSCLFGSPTATSNISIISGGNAVNRVPAACSLEFETRIIDNKQKEKINDIIKEIIKKNKFKAQSEITFSSSVTKCQNKEFVSIIEKITKKKAVGVNYTAENSFLPNSNCSIILGPGTIKCAHMPNEKVSKNSLYSAVKIYKELINKFCV